PPSGVPFYHFYTLFDLHNTDWHAVVRTVPTMLGLAFFSVLHVPINVPALAVSTAADRVDTNRELVAHGLSNVLAGALGTFPNYLVYSNSVLFIRSGGASNLAGSMLCVATLAVFVAGPALIGLIPTMVVGALIFHLGLELLREALIDTVGVVSRVEYATIAAIIAAMAALGFNEGIFLGILLACFFFILLYSRRSPLRKAYTGSAVRSTVRRLYGQRRFLDGVCRQIQVMRLQGFMFFGTINGVEASIRSLLEQRQWQANPIRFLVLDFALVTGLDFSAAEAFIRVRRLLEAREIYMVLSGVRRVSDVGRALRAAGVWSGAGPDDSDCVQTFASLNEALEWCENVLLQLYYLHHSSLGVSQQAFVSAGPQRYAFATPTPQPDAAADADAGILGTSPRYAMVERAVQSALPASPPLSPAPAATPALPLLAQAFHELEQEQPVDETLAFVAPRFVRKCLQAGQLLWRVGQRPLGMYVVESGSLRVFVDSATSDASADLADADADIDIDIDIDADADASLIESILPGTTLGELALVTGKPYSTTVVADADVVIWELSQTAFDELCAADPAHMLAFLPMRQQEFLEKTRQQHLKRALSVLVRAADYDSATSTSLDILSSIAILYMQSMFAQVHAYAEHATRTRPNMNDVGRALDERHISVAHLDAYLSRERELSQAPAIAAALNRIHALSQTPLQPHQAPRPADESFVFFDDRAEALLCQLVGNHVERVKERRRKEQLERQSRIEAAASKAISDLSVVSAAQTKAPRRALAVGRGKPKLSSSAIEIDTGASSEDDDFDIPNPTAGSQHRDRHEAENDHYEDDDDDEEDTRAKAFTSSVAGSSAGKSKDLRIRFSEASKGTDRRKSANGDGDGYGSIAEDENDDEEDEDEDADFEAPTVSIAQPRPSEATTSDTPNDGAQPSNDRRPDKATEPDPATKDGLQVPSEEGRENISSDSAQPERAVADEVEILLLPKKTLPGYIPTQCPAFPSPHTYKHTPVFPKREQDFFRNRMHKAEQSRQAEENLQRLISGPVAAEAAVSASVSASESAPETTPTPADQGEVGINPTSSSTDQAQHPEPAESSSENAQPAKQHSQQARKRILQLFPPANFRNADKRTRLTSLF
ncbi:hypothetical protein LPJ75_002491, partial [Coemansia sp. RSA 2598]